MLPIAAGDDVRNGRLTYAELSGESTSCLSMLMSSPDFYDFLWGEFRPVAGAVGVLGDGPSTPLGPHIEGIVSSIPKPEMGGIPTEFGIAGMADGAMSGVALGKKVRDSVCSVPFPSVRQTTVPVGAYWTLPDKAPSNALEHPPELFG